MPDRSIAPIAQDIHGISLVVPEKFFFDNGLTVLIFHSSSQDLVKAEFVFQNIFEQIENPLRNTSLSAMMKEGTSQYSSSQIAESIDYYGAYLMPEYSMDHTSMTLYTLNKYVDKVLPILYHILTDAIIPQKELETYIRNNKQSLHISLEKNEFLSRRMFYDALFGKNRYGMSPKEEDLDLLNRENLLQLYRQQIVPQNCTLILSGHINQDVLDQVALYFGTKWQRTSNVLKFHSPEFSNIRRGMHYKEREESLQSAIQMGMMTINRKHEDYPALQFVNTLFGGYFGSRLMQNIREDKGYTYGIGSSVVNLQHTGFWTMSTQVGVNVTQNTLDEIQKEFDLLRNKLAEEEEIELVRNYMLGSLLGSLESIFSHADKFKAVYFSEMDLSYYEYYTTVIKSMDPARVQQIAQQYFSYDNLIQVVTGKLN